MSKPQDADSYFLRAGGSCHTSSSNDHSSRVWAGWKADQNLLVSPAPGQVLKLSGLQRRKLGWETLREDLCQVG